MINQEVGAAAKVFFSKLTWHRYLQFSLDENVHFESIVLIKVLNYQYFLPKIRTFYCRIFYRMNENVFEMQIFVSNFGDNK